MSFTPSQLRALHRVHYEGGLSVQELARRGYKKWGYGSPESARRAIHKAFKKNHMKTLSREESSLRARGGHCKSCGIKWELRTPGCDVCTARHSHHRKTGGYFVPPVCVGCGSPYDVRNPKCRTCKSRFWSRKAKGYEKGSAPQTAIPQTE